MKNWIYQIPCPILSDYEDAASEHSNHETDSEMELDNEDSRNGSSDDDLPLSRIAYYTGKNGFKWSKSPPPVSRTQAHNIISQRPGIKGPAVAKIILSIFTLSLLASVMAQFEEYGYEGHGLEGYYKKPIVHHASQSLDHHDEYELDYHAHPKYTFDYSVKDPHTGDDKEHWETRDGDKVKGTYTLLETDGTKRVVEYEADDKNGFNAVVHKIGAPKDHHEYKPQPQKYTRIEPPYQRDNGHFDDGFVPIVGGYRR
ncbi:unnamed protein product [Diatraea saccharalis]|uniref:Uncharacterized protein n=1 Tax=Diatraea saccharalis TaxID=40085 RepID=A0A9N9WH36_9NEOP|nr:unnamed protein product [Diatraea saccharalis]